MQSISPVAQANWSGEQVGGSGEDRKTVTRAALPSAEKTEAARLVPRPLRLRCVCAASVLSAALARLERKRGTRVCREKT